MLCRRAGPPAVCSPAKSTAGAQNRAHLRVPVIIPRSSAVLRLLGRSTLRQDDGRQVMAAGAQPASAAVPPPPPPPPPRPHVLSIQSHVVHGWVGNKCAIFPLQLLGCEVDPIMSVQFSNHTGYPSWGGSVMDGAGLHQLVEGLATNGLLTHSHLLTGYMGSLSLLEEVAATARALRAANPQLVYVCDPVMGDEGQLYVNEQLVGAYRETIVPLANLLLPNQFEAQLLTGCTISSQQQALEAMQKLHAMGPHTVVMTSVSEASSSPHSISDGGAGSSSPSSGGGSSPRSSTITLLASTTLPQAPGRPQRFRLAIPRLDAYFTGTGDLLAALLLGWSHRHPDDLATAIEKAVAGLQQVLKGTVADCPPELLMRRDRSAEVFRARELAVVAQQAALVAPLVELLVEPLP